MAELDTAVVAGIRNLTTEVEKLDRATTKANTSASQTVGNFRRLGQDSGLKEQNGLLDGAVGKVAGIAAGVLSIRAAWRAVTNAVKEYYDQLARTNAEIARVLNLAQGMASGGGLHRLGAQMGTEARGIAALGAVDAPTLLAAAGRFKGISKDASDADIARFMRHAQQAGTTGESDLSSFAALYGTMHEAGVGHQQAADLAKLAQERMGGDSGAAMEVVRTAVGRYGPDSAAKVLGLLSAQARFGSRGMRAAGGDLKEWAMQGGGIDDFIAQQLAEDPALAGRYGAEASAFAGAGGHLQRSVAESTGPGNIAWAREVAIRRQQNRAAAARAARDYLPAQEEAYTLATSELAAMQENIQTPSYFAPRWTRNIWHRAEIGQEEVDAAAGNVTADLTREVARLGAAIDRLANSAEVSSGQKASD
jgi:hypothetical protein